MSAMEQIYLTARHHEILKEIATERSITAGSLARQMLSVGLLDPEGSALRAWVTSKYKVCRPNEARPSCVAFAAGNDGDRWKSAKFRAHDIAVQTELSAPMVLSIVLQSILEHRKQWEPVLWPEVPTPGPVISKEPRLVDGAWGE